MTKILMDADDIKQELGISKSLAYTLIRKFNAQLEEKGYTVIRGKISRKYFMEQFYGMSEKQ